MHVTRGAIISAALGVQQLLSYSRPVHHFLLASIIPSRLVAAVERQVVVNVWSAVWKRYGRLLVHIFHTVFR
jgi:hypothetical protein